MRTSIGKYSHRQIGRQPTFPSRNMFIISKTSIRKRTLDTKKILSPMLKKLLGYKTKDDENDNA